ncbi:MAG: RNA methyltransferase [Chlorobi bacterium]|nr:RNA methyltransferase [Chlorobiota bacterium]
MSKELINFLSSFITENRYSQFKDVLKNRTRYITVVLEDIYQSQNASAVLRTCDCFGVQDVHIIENKNEYKINPDVALGASKWLSLNYYRKKENNTLDAINKLKADGYRIVATTPHTNDVNLEEFDLTKGKTALVFGTELTGISDIVYDNADEFLKIPMYGFTESFNISVSAAIILHHLTYELRKADIDWQLNEKDSNDLLLNWIRSSVKKSKLLEKRFFEGKKNS